jgi:L-alanine-DL-glutamate epimerase-like enolase superfamily enzyme
MKITRVETFLLHVPVTHNQIADSTHRVTHWGAPGVILHTDSGLQGYGYTGTHGHEPSDKLILDCIAGSYAPLLIGENPHAVQHLWSKLHRCPPVHWVGRSGITHLALAAVDVALWDLKAKAAAVPLWMLLGGSDRDTVEGYNTDGGWLNWPLDRLVADCKRLVLDEGYRGVKIKVGSLDLLADAKRIAAVRNAIGASCKLMVDANGRWDLPAAMRMRNALRDNDVYWVEEPLWYDDVPGHARLAASISTPVALGEQLYALDAFRDFIQARAVHFVQPDAVRLAGITEWWQVADLALANRLPVVAHIGDMAQVHLHLSIAHRACTLLEYIPWMRECFIEPATVRDGTFVIPEQPGAGTTLRPDALERFGRRI